MKIVGLCAIVVLFALVQPVAADCSSSSGCKDCGYFPIPQIWDCATVERNASCSCDLDSGGSGCELTGTCTYTGGGSHTCV